MLKLEKIPRLRMKSVLVEEKDWKGLLALTVTIGYIMLLMFQAPNTETLGVAVGLIVGWYFSGKREEGKMSKFKLPRATEKHLDYKEIKAVLVEALKKTETYSPAYNDLLVGEIVKTVIDTRRVDREIDKARDLAKLRQAVSVKATLLGMLEDAVETLAISRRSRLRYKEAKLVKDTMMEGLKKACF